MRIPTTDSVQTREAAIQLAKTWQHSEGPHSWLEVAQWSDLFAQLGAKFDLTEEFKENGLL
jgi:hypothetical protein